jgi:hypothetical protein
MDIRISLLEHFGIVSSGLCGRIHNKEERLDVSASFRTIPGVAAKCLTRLLSACPAELATAGALVDRLIRIEIHVNVFKLARGRVRKLVDV